jgi:hypothetical protein
MVVDLVLFWEKLASTPEMGALEIELRITDRLRQSSGAFFTRRI